jgi:hypothetical protein
MPAGVIVLPELGNAREGVRNALPVFPIEAFDLIASTYRMQSEHKAEPRADVVRKLEGIAETAVNFRRDLLCLSEEAHGALWDGAYEIGRATIIEEAQHALFLLGRAAQAGHNATKAAGVRAGAPSGARQVMVRAFVYQLEQLGLEVDAKESGNLVFLVRSVFLGYGEEVKGVRELVRDALGKMRGEGAYSPR